MTLRGCWDCMRFAIKNTQIELSFWFAFVVCFLLTCSDNTVIQLTVLFSLLHECGHLLSDCRFGVRPQTIRFGLFGMTIVRAADLRLSYRQEICTALAGPSVNLFFCLLFLGLYCKKNDMLFLQCGVVNLYIFAFNAMPVFSLDGGRALEAFLQSRLQNENRILTVQKAVSLLCISVVMCFGFIILFSSKRNFTLLLLSVYLIFTLFQKCGT